MPFQLVYSLGVLFLLNYGDWLFTVRGLAMGVIEEANPLMAPWISAHPLAVLGIKWLASFVLVALCWAAFRSTGKPWVLWAPWGVAGLLVGVMGLHLRWVWISG